MSTLHTGVDAELEAVGLVVAVIPVVVVMAGAIQAVEPFNMPPLEFLYIWVCINIYYLFDKSMKYSNSILKCGISYN